MRVGRFDDFLDESIFSKGNSKLKDYATWAKFPFFADTTALAHDLAPFNFAVVSEKWPIWHTTRVTQAYPRLLAVVVVQAASGLPLKLPFSTLSNCAF